jgi:hypothetical protein
VFGGGGGGGGCRLLTLQSRLNGINNDQQNTSRPCLHCAPRLVSVSGLSLDLSMACTHFFVQGVSKMFIKLASGTNHPLCCRCLVVSRYYMPFYGMHAHSKDGMWCSVMVAVG